MTANIELRNDAGALACATDFFRSQRFLRAEHVSHSLVISTRTGRAVIPLIVRTIPGTRYRDAVSPYGYPGGTLDGEPPDLANVDLSGIRLISVFLRDRLGVPTVKGATKRRRVLLYDPAVPRSLSKSFRRDVRRNKCASFTVELYRGRSVEDRTLYDFAEVYVETMRRVRAAERYYFSVQYLRECLNVEGTWLALVRAPNGDAAAGELVVNSDGILHSYLAGTRSRYRSNSPGKNGVARLLDLADELGTRLNFGGGLTEDDGIEASKRSYANTEDAFVTHELICDEAQYALLADGVAETSFFPRYRALPEPKA